jgi:hypothetical protein
MGISLKWVPKETCYLVAAPWAMSGSITPYDGSNTILVCYLSLYAYTVDIYIYIYIYIIYTICICIYLYISSLCFTVGITSPDIARRGNRQQRQVSSFCPSQLSDIPILDACKYVHRIRAKYGNTRGEAAFQIYGAITEGVGTCPWCVSVM